MTAYTYTRESARVRAEKKAVEMGARILSHSDTEFTYITTNGRFRITQHFDTDGNFIALDRVEIA